MQDVHNHSMDSAGRNLEGADGNAGTAAALAAGEQNGVFSSFLESIVDGVSSLLGDASGDDRAALSSSAAAASSAGSQPPADSWWNKVPSTLGYGVAQERGAMSVTCPLGASTASAEYPAQRRGDASASSAAAARSSPRSEETGVC